MSPQNRTVEEKIAWIASRSWGVVTRDDMLRAGISEAQIKWRARTGYLIREYAGVYRVGHTAPSDEALYTAAVKACGKNAVLADRAAAHLYSILKCRRAPAPEVITTTERCIEGITTRRCREIDRRDVRVFRGIRVTTVPRTLVDLAALLTFDALARACHEAGVRYRTTPGDVAEVLARRPNARGSRNLRRIMNGEARVTLSKLERRFLELLREAGLPLPITNRPAGGRRVDCRWPDYKLTVELDSYTYHRSRHAWELDRRREREAYARGDEHHRRYTYDDVFVDPGPMLRELEGLLRPQRGSRTRKSIAS